MEHEMHHIKNAVMPTHEWRGIAIKDLTPPDATWNGSLVEVDVPAGVRHPQARSTKCETFYYCDRGALEFDVNGQQFRVTPGDLVVIEPNEWYSYRNESSAPGRLLSFNIPPYDASATEIQDN
jgi:mannose-6-phosphate isomerase-like protein (cupin superfamily)